MVLAFHGCSEFEDDLINLLGTRADGTNFRSIVNVDGLGFRVEIREDGLYSDLEAVYAARTPLVVAVNTDEFPAYPKPGGAYCLVVAGATSDEVYVYDPDRHDAPESISAASFKAGWAKAWHRMARLSPRRRV